eukprot:357474-Chlamydomonas_euryale.AAC.2
MGRPFLDPHLPTVWEHPGYLLQSACRGRALARPSTPFPKPSAGASPSRWNPLHRCGPQGTYLCVHIKGSNAATVARRRRRLCHQAERQ